ncbi:MAG: glycosyltransferase family 39 protein [Chloroflexi bacterium]|nr:glycosyltransferase family 39 protein [Chloroflexota bacterium]
MGMWIRRALPRLRPSFRSPVAIAVVVNLVVLPLFLWSRPGQTTHVRIEARGDQVSAYVDGHAVARANTGAVQSGGVTIDTSAKSNNAPPVPGPRGPGRLKVTDLNTGEVLFDLDLGGLPDARRGEALTTLRDATWSDYAVDIDLRNTFRAHVTVRNSDTGAVTFSFRRLGLSGSQIELRRTGPGPSVSLGTQLTISRIETGRGLSATVLRFYPTFLLASGVLALFGLAVGLIARAARIDAPGFRVPRWVPPAAVCGAALSVAVVCAILISAYGDRMPHIADETSYLFQARLLSHGRAWANPPPVAESFGVGQVSFIFDFDGRWTSFYPFGHPLVLSLGTFAGATWLMPPLVAALMVVLTYLSARQLFDAKTGVVAALLLATSPFLLMNGSSFMSHNTAAMFAMASVWCLTDRHSRSPVRAAAGGVFYGLLFNTRQLPAVVLLLPLVALFTLALRSGYDRREIVTRAGAAALGLAILGGCYLAYNWLLTGNPLQNGYQAGGDLSQTVGFSGPHSLAAGLDIELTHITGLILVLNGWPPAVGLLLVFAPFLLGTRKAADWILLLAATALVAAPIIYYVSAAVYGPRYVFEALPFLAILSARGVIALSSFSARAFARAGGRGGSIAAAAPIYAVLALLVGLSVHGWLFNGNSDWGMPGVPSRSGELDGYALIDDRIGERVDSERLHDALVLVKPCGTAYDPCYLSVFWRNSTSLDGDVVYARDLGPETNQRLFAAYPCRAIFTATYDQLTLVPAGVSPPAPGSVC